MIHRVQRDQGNGTESPSPRGVAKSARNMATHWPKNDENLLPVDGHQHLENTTHLRGFPRGTKGEPRGIQQTRATHLCHMPCGPPSTPFYVANCPPCASAPHRWVPARCFRNERSCGTSATWASSSGARRPETITGTLLGGTPITGLYGDITELLYVCCYIYVCVYIWKYIYIYLSIYVIYRAHVNYK